jgi:hypothetical protein
MELYKQKLSLIPQIPILNCKAINYVFEKNLVPTDGIWIEFGTYTGNSLNKIATYTDKTVYGFDSFEGLPDAWVGRIDENGLFHWPPGTFSLGGNSNINVLPNVKLIKGWFKDTIPGFLKEVNRPIAFMHIDGDIYSSTRDIFESSYKYIKEGCVIAFDELLGYPNFEEHEWKAWWEFVEKYEIEFEWIGCNLGGFDIITKDKPFGYLSPTYGCVVSPSYENAAVRITRNKFYDKNLA